MAIDTERLLPKPAEKKRFSQELLVYFRRFVGETAGGKDAHPELVDAADFTLPNGRINPAWLEWYRAYNKRVGVRTPGRLIFDRDSGQYSSAEPGSPIGEVSAVRDFARQALHATPEEKRRIEREARRILAGIFNDYAGERFNGVRDVADRKDFRGVNIGYLAARGLPSWSQDLLRTRQQSAVPVFFDRWEGADPGIKTPTRADQFFYTVFKELSAEEGGVSPRAQAMRNLLGQEATVSYIEIAGMFYAGDMLKTFINLSAVAKMTGSNIPEGWQSFQGNTGEFRRLKEGLGNIQQGLDGYLAAADELYGGDMLKTFINLSAVVKMTGSNIQEGWQKFQGNTVEFRRQLEWIKNNPHATEEHFTEQFKGKNSRRNFSAISNMVGCD